MTEQKKIFESAFKLHQNGDLKEAEVLLKKNLVSFPKHLPSIFLLGTLSAQIHKFQTAKTGKWYQEVSQKISHIYIQ